MYLVSVLRSVDTGCLVHIPGHILNFYNVNKKSLALVCVVSPCSAGFKEKWHRGRVQEEDSGSHHSGRDSGKESRSPEEG